MSVFPRLVSRNERAACFILFIIFLLAGWLRFYQLGLPALERNEDEDIMAAAVMAILDHGYPELPGGMVYLRSAPLLYLMAGSVELFGLSEFSLRLPATVFGFLLVPLGYFVGRRYFGQTCALVAAALIAVSFWEVEVSRTARMYAPFAFFYTVSLYAICRGYVENVVSWRWIVLPLVATTVAIHMLGFTLAAAFALAAVAPRQTLMSRIAAFGSAALTGVFVLVGRAIQGAGFNRPKVLFELSSGADTIAQGVADSIVARVLNQLALPEDRLFLSSEPAIRLWLAVAIMGSIVLLVILLRHSAAMRRPWPIMMLLACLISGVIQQFIFAALFFGAFAIVQGDGLRTLLQRNTLIVAAGLAILFLGWFFLGVTGSTGVNLSPYETLRALFDFPRAEVLRPFLLDRLFLLLLAGVGLAWALHNASVQREMTPQALLAGAIIIALVLHGVLQSQFRERYNFNLDIIYLIFAAAGAVRIVDFATKRLRELRLWSASESSWAAATTAVPMVFAVLVSWPDLRPATSLAYVSSWEGSSAQWADHHGLEWPVDRKSTAVYVKSHAAPDDEVLTMDWMTSYFYAGKVDYWLRSSRYKDVSYRDKEGWREMYLGSRIVSDAETLEDLITNRENTLWIITSGWVMRRQLHNLSPEIVRLIDDLRPYRVYQGLDGVSAVYRVPARSVTSHQESKPG